MRSSGKAKSNKSVRMGKLPGAKTFA
jgi:hypothetical protein